MPGSVESLTGRDLSQLRWLAQQDRPVWGGSPFDRPANDIPRWLDAGLIDRVSQPERGYRITAAGRNAVAEADRLRPPPGDGPAVVGDPPPIRWLQTSSTSRTLQVLHCGAWINVPIVRGGPNGRS